MSEVLSNHHQKKSIGPNCRGEIDLMLFSKRTVSLFKNICFISYMSQVLIFTDIKLNPLNAQLKVYDPPPPQFIIFEEEVKNIYMYMPQSVGRIIPR